MSGDNARRAIDDARALLDQLTASGTDTLRIQMPVLAPHVATVEWLADSGTRLAASACVARLRVLEDVEEITVEAPCVVLRLETEVGALVEYGQAIVTVAAS